MDDTGVAIHLLDCLHPDAGVDQFPVLVFCIRIKIPQLTHAGVHALGALLDEVLHQRDVVQPDLDQRRDIVPAHRSGEIEVAASLVQKLGRPRRIWAKQQRLFAIDDSRVEMRHRHRGCGTGRHAVDLGHVLLDNFRLVTNEPLAADRKAAISPALLDAGLLQQRQTAAPGPDKDELGRVVKRPAVLQIFHLHPPTPIGCFREINHAMSCRVAATGLLPQPLDKHLGQGAKVDVRPAVHLGRGDRRIVTPGQQQRRPLEDRITVLRVFHAAEKMMRAHPLVSRAQEVHLFLPVHKRNVRHGADEFLRVIDQAVAHGVAPEIFRLLELLKNLDRLGHIDLAVIAAVRGVAQFANSGMAGAGVVPTVGTLLRQLLSDLVQLNLQVGLKILQYRTERGAHDAAANQDHIRIFNVLSAAHKRAQRMRKKECESKRNPTASDGLNAAPFCGFIPVSSRLTRLF